ncbi:MAG TPA: PAS domain-containing protein [Byssovorax sp.]|jgi:PAS domain-containing protein
MTPRPRAVPITLDFALLRGAIEEIPFGVATMRGSDVTYANAALERTFGARPGGLDRATLATLFPQPALGEIERGLDEKRVFDGRVRGKGIDGRAFDAEVHVERYVASQGTGGFVVVRDVTLELGALGRLVDLLGGAIFRYRVDGGRAQPSKKAHRSPLEYVSPSILRITGLEAEAGMANPELFMKLLSTEERDRLGFQFRRLAHGDVTTATAQVNLRRPDGQTRLLQLRATGRLDTAGVVRHVEGVVTDAAPSVVTRADDDGSDRPTGPDSPPPEQITAPAPNDFSEALMIVAEHLLREADQHHQTLGREVRLLRTALASDGPTVASDATGRLARITAATAGATVLTRRVRRAMRRGPGHATVADLVENVRGALAPSFGEAPLLVTASSDVQDLLLQNRVDELTLCLLHISLRAFRVAGSGSLRLHASLEQGGDVCFDVSALGPPAHGTSDGDSGRASLYADLADLRETAHALMTSFGGSVHADLRAGPEVKVLLHLPR